LLLDLNVQVVEILKLLVLLKCKLGVALLCVVVGGPVIRHRAISLQVTVLIEILGVQHRHRVRTIRLIATLLV
jgi:hypothetical protein